MTGSLGDPRSMVAGDFMGPPRLRQATRLRNVVSIVRVSQLEQLAGWTDFLRRPRALRLELPDMGSDERESWQSKINRHLSACGCEEGAVTLLIAAAIHAQY